MVSKDEIREAVQRIHELALAYRGPREAEFHELALRTRLVDTNEHPAKGTEPLSPQLEALDIEEQFQDALAILFAIAFPATRNTANEVFEGLSDLLSQPVSDALIVGIDKPFRLKSQLKKGIPIRQQELFEYFKQLLPEEDSLNGQY